MTYSAVVMDHFGRPRNVGPPEGWNCSGLAGTPDAGPFHRVYLAVKVGRIVAAGFETYGCVAAIAAGSVLTERLRGRSAAEAGAVTADDLLAWLGGLPLGQRSCAELAIFALRAALAAMAERE